MYIILDNRLQRIGTLSDHSLNGTPFYNDQITQQIADDDQEMSIQSVPDTTNYSDPNGNTKNWGHTLDSIYVPYGYPDTDKIAEGNSLAYQDPSNGHWYIMRITNVTDAVDNSGAHYKEASGCNLCIWKLGKTVHYMDNIQNANSNRAFGALFDDTGWYINPDSEPVGGSADISFDGTSSDQSLLQQFCQIYGAEIDAYVLFPESVKMKDGKYYSSDFQVALKRVDIKRHLGTDNGDRIVYGRNATNIQRTIVDDNLYTRLYVYGPGGATCACNLTNNKPYVQDNVANDKWNPGYGDNAENYLEGAITSQTMKNPERLAQWGMQQLQIFNHPRANYTVGVASVFNQKRENKIVNKASLGDTFRVIDLKMDPVMTVQARVIRKTLSFANPSQNQITLGEYTTVNVVPPKFITDLQQSEYNRVNQIINEIKTNPSALTCTIDKPDGCTWRYKEPQKRFIAHVYVMGDDITNLIEPKGFVWELFQNGEPNNDFYKAHNITHNDGQTLVLNNDIDLGSDVTNTLDHNLNPSPNNNNKDDIPNNSPSSNNNDNIPNSNSDNDSNNIDNKNGFFNGGGVDIPDAINNSTPMEATSPNIKLSESNSSDDSNDDDEPSGDNFNINSSNIEDYLNGPDLVTGTVKLLIDTDYITDHTGVNFNTNTMQHVFTVNQWTDSWGDPRKGIFQFINYNPNNNCYYVALDYYGKYHNERSTGDTEIARLDTNGNYLDSMLLLCSQFNSSFGLDYTTPGGPYIWAVSQYNYNSDEIIRLPYNAGNIVNLNDNDSYKVSEFSEPNCTVYYDNSSSILVFSHDNSNSSPSHEVDFYKSNELLDKGNNAQPIHSIRLTDYGFDPKSLAYNINNDPLDSNSITHNSDSDNSRQTYQSCSLRYPYFFFDSGDGDMSDQRMVYCIDIKHGSLQFALPLDLDLFHLNTPDNIVGKNPGDYTSVTPETINWTVDNNGNPCFLFGLNVNFSNDKTGQYQYDENGISEPTYKQFQFLYKIGMDLNNSATNNNSQNNPDHSNNGRPTI